MRRVVLTCVGGALCVTASFAAYRSSLSAQGVPSPFPDPNTCDPAVCGKTSPLIPMQSTEAVHMGLVWKRNSPTPKILYHARFPEYTPNDVADPAIVDTIVNSPRDATTGFTLMDNGATDFNAALRDVLNPFFAPGRTPRRIRSNG